MMAGHQAQEAFAVADNRHMANPVFQHDPLGLSGWGGGPDYYGMASHTVFD
jgi:hypothetical protein